MYPLSFIVEYHKNRETKSLCKTIFRKGCFVFIFFTKVEMIDNVISFHN